MELEINDTTCTVIPVSYQKLPKMVGWERTYAEKTMLCESITDLGLLLIFHSEIMGLFQFDSASSGFQFP
jgi:hypothetical protein